jgi:hypothetical protein
MAGDRVFFLTNLPPPGPYPRDYAHVMQRTGRNTGNIFFVEALRRQLAYERADFGVRADPVMVRENFDYIAVPAANWLAPKKAVSSDTLRLIEKSSLPCFVAGLGAQSLDARSVPPLSEETQRFLHLVSERSAVVGVRGDYTLRVVEHYGVRNAAAIGCPSYFWNLKPALEIIRSSHSDLLRVAVNGSRNRRIRPALDRKKLEVERQLYEHALRSDVSFIVPQTEEFEIEMALGTPYGEIPRSAVKSFQEFMGAYRPIEGQEEGARGKFRVFTDVTSWMAELSGVDFVVGTRLHGCIMGLGAGVPSLLITIDSRTAELANLLRIPAIPVDQVRLPLDITQLYQLADPREAISEYPSRYRAYKEFLSANGTAHCLV